MNLHGKTFKIGTIVYTIDMQTCQEILSAQNLWGEILYKEQVIRLRNDVPQQRLFQVLCHELIHAMLEESGLSEQNKEAFVLVLGVALTQFLTDNTRQVSNILGIID